MPLSGSELALRQPLLVAIKAAMQTAGNTYGQLNACKDPYADDLPRDSSESRPTHPVPASVIVPPEESSPDRKDSARVVLLKQTIRALWIVSYRSASINDRDQGARPLLTVPY